MNKKEPKDIKKKVLTIYTTEDSMKDLLSKKPEYETTPNFVRRVISEALQINLK